MGDLTPPAVEDPPITDAAQKAQFSERVLIKTILSQVDGGDGLAGQTVKVGGWVKTGREANKGDFAFLELNDGSRTNTATATNFASSKIEAQRARREQNRNDSSTCSRRMLAQRARRERERSGNYTQPLANMVTAVSLPEHSPTQLCNFEVGLSDSNNIPVNVLSECALNQLHMEKSHVNNLNNQSVIPSSTKGEFKCESLEQPTCRSIFDEGGKKIGISIAKKNWFTQSVYIERYLV